jgi:signal transduction histidine kinase/DNA-binding NarL/FixJ family response regulator
MTKFKIEIQITLLAIIIGVVVATIGYFSYKSLSKIVFNIHQETQPDNKLSLIKDITTELTTLERTTRLYILTNNVEDLLNYQSLQRHIVLNLRKLNIIRGKYNPESALIDSIAKLSVEKLELWQGILEMNLSVKNNSTALTGAYSLLYDTQADTLKKVIKKTASQGEISNQKKPDTDTTLTVNSTDANVIKQKLKRLEREMVKKGKEKNILESHLLEKNIIIGKKMNKLIAAAENKENNDLLEKANEADRLAAVTYKWLALFTISAVLLLTTALFVLFNYLEKTRIYQRALNDAKNTAETLASAKEQFAANVSHELRTPVNAIYGLTEQVLQKPLEPETSEIISIIFKSASHLMNIINDTLDFSKMQANKIRFETVHFSPIELFEEVISLQKYEATQKGISIHFNWHGKRTDALIGDPLRLKQILINLISNAIKFTEKGEIAVTVNGFKTADQSFELEIQVSDTGIGMTEKNLHVIFDEFVQINNKSGKKYSGTGLGLAIVKKLVELQRGKINIESKVGKGTKVTVKIPYILGASERIKKSGDEIMLIPEKLKQFHILIADDDEYNRFLIKSILNKWGIKFKEAKNGTEVIKSTQKEKFDVILMDINMPEINGIEASKKITKFNSDIRIVATTAENDRIDLQACINSGMKGFLLKPFTEKELFDILDSMLLTQNNLITANNSKQINMAELTRFAKGDKKFLSEMILLFINSVESGITNIENAIENNNWQNVFEFAHKMAAPTKHIGAKHLYKDIKTLEKMAQQTEQMESINQFFQNLKSELTELNAALKSHLDEIETYPA